MGWNFPGSASSSNKQQSPPALGKASTALDVLTVLRKENNLAAFVTEKKESVAVVTGGNSGIGAVTVETLALAGMKVVLCARNGESAQETKQNMPEYLQSSVDIQIMDLANLTSVEEASKEIVDKYSTIDVIVNNAGVMAPPKRMTTADGLEVQFGTNHVGHHMLTRLLLPSLQPMGRIVTVASTAHQFVSSAEVNWDPSKYSGWTEYGKSKLANILFAKRLQELLIQQGKTDIKSVALHPGVIGTKLWRFAPKPLQPLVGWVLADKTVPQGAATNVYCALAGDVQNGAYYNNCKVAQPTNVAEDARLRKTLWEYTEQLIGDKGFVLPAMTREETSNVAEPQVV